MFGVGGEKAIKSNPPDDKALLFFPFLLLLPGVVGDDLVNACGGFAVVIPLPAI